MKKLHLLLCALFIINVTNAQPNIQWQKSLGGTYDDFAYSIQQTTDGGYIVAGASYSNDGDVTGNHGTAGVYSDYWVVKLNATGTIAWQKSLGGTYFDYARSIQQTTDGGYIVAGWSYSNDGDVTGHHGTAVDSSDCWIVKLNPTGTIAWQKSLGGTHQDFAKSIRQTTDGGYIVVVTSHSNDGDVTGNHGSSDYWVVKINSTGNIEWQKSLGGANYEEATLIQQTTDGGYIVSGSSRSNDGDVTGHHGTTNNSDYWIVKLNSTGTIEWQKSLGGSTNDGASSIQQTTDGGYIVAGRSGSIDGDVTGHHGASSNYDYWVVKLNSTGTLAWQKSLGGTDYDGAYSIQETTDGGYFVAGESGSNDGDVTGNHGSYDYWLVKLNSTGTIVWQKSLGGTYGDGAYSIQQTTDDGYIIAGNSHSNDGDVTGNHGGGDYWVVKLYPVSGVNELSKNSGNLNVYPNPANKVITIETNAINNEQLTIINIKGQEVKKLHVKDCKLQVDVSDLPAGLYFVKLLSEKGVSVAKFVKD